MKRGWLLLGAVLCACIQQSQERASMREPPRLVVQITVDQLRADLLERVHTRLAPNGLRRLLEQGVDYRAASYAHAITETAVGHATLFTGALPRDHGIIANEWFSRDTGAARAAVDDPESPIVTGRGPGLGAVSPRALLVTTLGDELWLASQGRSLVYAVSAKDRGAILPAGHRGKAFWLDDKSGGMVSSRYYFASLPAWVGDFNASHGPDQLADATWNLLEAKPRYLRAGADDVSWERPPRGLGRSFPHRLSQVEASARVAALRRTPELDTWTLEFVEALLAHEPLGKDAVPDLLSISFSATDYIAHAFGPESLELEDQLLRLDRSIARLLELLLVRLRREQLIVVLSADHGGCESPEFLAAQGLPAGRHDVPALLTTLRAQLEAVYGPGPELLLGFVNPYLWLDEAAVAERKLELSAVEDTLAALALAQPGFARAYPAHDLAVQQAGGDPIALRASNSFHPTRSGHVHLVPATGWLLASDADRIASMHGTPHRYDTDVQLSFFGGSLRPQRVYTPVDPRDIAPTLAALLGVKVPSAASGRVLTEIVGARDR
jgi:predicted AlkP superfamily pyrophosphatase or phosphodiesterase